jgi:hypothetical protein
VKPKDNLHCLTKLSKKSISEKSGLVNKGFRSSKLLKSGLFRQSQQAYASDAVNRAVDAPAVRQPKGVSVRAIFRKTLGPSSQQSPTSASSKRPTPGCGVFSAWKWLSVPDRRRASPGIARRAPDG